METQEQAQDPWAEDHEPPVQSASEREPDAGESKLPPIFTSTNAETYLTRMTPRSIEDAEQMLLLAQHDFEMACESAVTASTDYADAESQQARTKVRVIEKLMSNNADAQDRVQNSKKKDDGALSFTAAEKIASGHPEYTAVRDYVTEALNVKTEAERRAQIAEQRVLTLREIVKNRRKVAHRNAYPTYSIEHALQIGQDLGGKHAAAPLPRHIDLSERDVDKIAQRDSRGLDGIERKPMVQTRPATTVEREWLSPQPSAALSSTTSSDHSSLCAARA